MHPISPSLCLSTRESSYMYTYVCSVQASRSCVCEFVYRARMYRNGSISAVSLSRPASGLGGSLHDIRFPVPPAGIEPGISRKNLEPFLDLCVSSLRRGHANLLCIFPILSVVPKHVYTHAIMIYIHTKCTLMTQSPPSFPPQHTAHTHSHFHAHITCVA